MQLAASSDLVSGTKARPRPFGSGRLFAWSVRQDACLSQGSAPRSPVAGPEIARGGLDPVTERIGGACWGMSFGQIARFIIDFTNNTVRLVEAHPDADRETIDHLLDDHVAPRVIAADGALVLHGSATLIGSHIAVFLGSTGSGKSTLSASLHAAGHRLLGDDAVVIEEADGVFTGAAVYPSLRLYRESIAQVFAENLPTSAMAFYSEKRHVGVPGLPTSAPECFPLGAVFVLTQGDSGVTPYRLSPVEGCIALLENSFALDPQDGAVAARRMAAAARMAAAVPCYELAYPYDFSLLPEIRDHVTRSLAHLSTAA